MWLCLTKNGIDGQAVFSDAPTGALAANVEPFEGTEPGHLALHGPGVAGPEPGDLALADGQVVAGPVVRRGDQGDVNGGLKTCHCGGAKVGQSLEPALDVIPHSATALSCARSNLVAFSLRGFSSGRVFSLTAKISS